MTRRPMAAAVEQLLRRASAGEVVLVVNTLVMAEIVWALESYYSLTIDFVDAFNAAWALGQGVTVTSTFDRKHFAHRGD